MTSINFKGSSDCSEVSSLLAELIKIESVNKDYKGSNQGESNISNYIYQYFQNLDVNCIKDEVLPDRCNVICHIEGKDKRGLCLESHTDTVSIDNMAIDPLDPIVKEGKMFGRGSADDKGSLAAMMIAIKNLVKNNIKPSTDLYFIAAVDEEYQHRGVDHFLTKGIKLQGAVVGEPTQLNIVTACKGVTRFEITTYGLSAHSSKPEKGHSAIYDMMEVVYGIKNDLLPSFKNKTHRLLGSPTMSIGCINGGTAANIIPDRCTILIDRRTLPGESWDNVKKDMLGLLGKLKNKNLNFTISEPSTSSDAIDTDINEKIVKTVLESCNKIIGKSIIEGVSYGCDASSFTSVGVPSIVLGPGNILQAHTKDEFVCLEEVCQAAEIYSQICVDF